MHITAAMVFGALSTVDRPFVPSLNVSVAPHMELSEDDEPANVNNELA